MKIKIQFNHKIKKNEKSLQRDKERDEGVPPERRSKLDIRDLLVRRRRSNRKEQNKKKKYNKWLDS